MTIDTERLRERLLTQKQQLQEQIRHHDIGRSSLVDETGELVSSSADNHLADTASETFERELDEGLEERAARELEEVEAALARIEEGGYGTCEACGRPISPERLEAVPWTTLCIDDARKQSR